MVTERRRSALLPARYAEIAVGFDALAREDDRGRLEAEVAEYIERFTGELDENGRRLLVRNGRARERKLTVGAGTGAVRAPRVNDKRTDPETGERRKFSSRILPAYRAALAEGDRGAAGLVFAWALDRRL
jgi:hypothetical protein